jgi:hypothetical protein
MGAALKKESSETPKERRRQQKQFTLWLAHAPLDVDALVDERIPEHLKAMTSILLPKTLTFVNKHMEQKRYQCSELLETGSKIAFISHKWDGVNPDPGGLVKREIANGEYDLYWIDYLCNGLKAGTGLLSVILVRLLQMKVVMIKVNNSKAYYHSLWCLFECICFGQETPTFSVVDLSLLTVEEDEILILVTVRRLLRERLITEDTAKLIITLLRQEISHRELVENGFRL